MSEWSGFHAVDSTGTISALPPQMGQRWSGSSLMCESVDILKSYDPLRATGRAKGHCVVWPMSLDWVPACRGPWELSRGRHRAGAAAAGTSEPRTSIISKETLHRQHHRHHRQCFGWSRPDIGLWWRRTGAARADGSRHRRSLGSSSRPRTDLVPARDVCLGRRPQKERNQPPSRPSPHIRQRLLSTSASRRRRSSRSRTRLPIHRLRPGPAHLSAGLAKVRSAIRICVRADASVRNVPAMSNVSDFVRSNVQYVRLN